MNKYSDMVAYPIMYAVVYVLVGILNWNRDPETWHLGARTIWIIWGTTWGYALQLRITRIRKQHESPSNPC